MLKAKLDQDLKKALLEGDKQRATTLRGLKSAIQYVEVAQNARDTGLDDQAIIEVLSKEAKKRQESADMYQKGSDMTRATSELQEKSIIEEYLPNQLSDQELQELVEKVCDELGANSLQFMGKVIAEIKQRSAGRAEGSRIAKSVKERLA